MAQVAGRTFAPPRGMECADLTARKVHQYAVVGVAALALLLGGTLGAALVTVDGAIMLLGRFWGPADLFRQLVWRVAEPRGWLAPWPVPEELGTRRIARVLGGVALFAAGAALYTQNLLLALGIALPLCAMILFDASLNFCALCFLNYQARRLRYLLTNR
ncbi:MAG: DUF4395 family protein [Chloroflexota bacterium]